ncbi:MAG: META domain-containing protein [Pseudomonadota bacterium]
MSKLKRFALVSVFAGAAALAFGMSRPDETISGYSGEDEFVLAEMMGSPVDVHVTIAFPEEGKIVGQAPCNRYFTSQDAPLPWFQVGPIGATKMACENLDIEQQYFDLLSKATLAEIQGDQLLLSNDSQVLLSFMR